MNHQSKSLLQLSIQKFKKNTLGVVCFWLVTLCGFIAIFGYTFAPDNSRNANQMHLEIHSKEPGFSTLMHIIPTDKNADDSFFNGILYGKANLDQEIPIRSYEVKDRQLEYVRFSDGLTNPSH